MFIFRSDHTFSMVDIKWCNNLQMIEEEEEEEEEEDDKAAFVFSRSGLSDVPVGQDQNGTEVHFGES